MVYLDCSEVLLVVICRTLHLSGWSCISYWSSHFCNVSRSCCRVRRSSSDLILWYRLINYGFTSRSRIFHLYGNVTITGQGLQNLGLCSALRTFHQGGIFIVPHLLWHGTSVFPVSSEGPPHSVAFTTHIRMWSIYSNPDPHVSPFSHLLRHARGWGGPILTRILTVVWYRGQSSANSMVVDFTASRHELFQVFLKGIICWSKTGQSLCSWRWYASGFESPLRRNLVSCKIILRSSDS
jgi:hypothetical protein